jgi:hypothetical protein
MEEEADRRTSKLSGSELPGTSWWLVDFLRRLATFIETADQLFPVELIRRSSTESTKSRKSNPSLSATKTRDLVESYAVITDIDREKLDILLRRRNAGSSGGADSDEAASVEGKQAVDRKLPFSEEELQELQERVIRLDRQLNACLELAAASTTDQQPAQTTAEGA